MAPVASMRRGKTLPRQPPRALQEQTSRKCQMSAGQAVQAVSFESSSCSRRRRLSRPSDAGRCAVGPQSALSDQHSARKAIPRAGFGQPRRHFGEGPASLYDEVSSSTVDQRPLTNAMSLLLQAEINSALGEVIQAIPIAMLSPHTLMAMVRDFERQLGANEPIWQHDRDLCAQCARYVQKLVTRSLNAKSCLVPLAPAVDLNIRETCMKLQSRNQVERIVRADWPATFVPFLPRLRSLIAQWNSFRSTGPIAQLSRIFWKTVGIGGELVWHSGNVQRFGRLAFIHNNLPDPKFPEEVWYQFFIECGSDPNASFDLLGAARFARHLFERVLTLASAHAAVCSSVCGRATDTESHAQARVRSVEPIECPNNSSWSCHAGSPAWDGATPRQLAELALALGDQDSVPMSRVTSGTPAMADVPDSHPSGPRNCERGVSLATRVRCLIAEKSVEEYTHSRDLESCNSPDECSLPKTNALDRCVRLPSSTCKRYFTREQVASADEDNEGTKDKDAVDDGKNCPAESSVPDTTLGTATQESNSERGLAPTRSQGTQWFVMYTPPDSPPAEGREIINTDVPAVSDLFRRLRDVEHEVERIRSQELHFAQKSLQRLVGCDIDDEILTMGSPESLSLDSAGWWEEPKERFLGSALVTQVRSVPVDRTPSHVQCQQQGQAVIDFEQEP